MEGEGQNTRVETRTCFCRLSPDITKHVTGATKKQYAPYIKQWHQLCLQWGSDPLQPDIGLALDFLADLQG